MKPPPANPTPALGKSESEPDASSGYYPSAKVPRWLVAAFFLFVAAVAVGLGYFVWNQFRAELDAVEDELRSVTELKISQLVAWRQERFADAVVVSNLPGLADMFSQMSAAPGAVPSRLEEIDNYLNAALRAYSYGEIHLLDPSLRPVRSYPVGRVWDGVLSPQLREELLRVNVGTNRPESPLVEDLHLDKTGLTSMHMLVRVRSASGEPAGVVLLSISAEAGLFSLMQSWPVESATAETLLVRREGDSVRYLSPPRNHTGAAMHLSLPLTQPELLAAKALKAEKGDLLRGRDYRGVPVVGVVLPVPGTPWIMFSKMDQGEAYAKAWLEFWQLSVGLVFLLLVLVLFGWLWLHHRQSEHISRRLESERRRRTAAERLAIVMRHANDVIFLFDESMRILDANERAVAAYGYTLPELRQLTAADLRTVEANAEVQRQFAAAQNDEGFTFETMHRKKEGATFPVEVSSRPVMVDGRRQVLSIVREISERKAHEQEIERLNRLYLVISEVNQALVRARSREELFAEISEVLVKFGGFRIVWMGWLNAQTRCIDAVAVAGDTTGYTHGIRIATDAELPEGRGPSGTAFRENRVYVSNDFFTDPNTGPWRERAARAGFQATIALPLQEEGVTLGLLTVYAAEKDFFQAKEIELLKETAGDISFALEIFARERRRQTAEVALQASESRLQFLISATPAIIYSLRAGGDFATTFLSPNIREVLGYESAAVMADPSFWAAHLHPDDAAMVISQIAKLESQATITREYRFRHANGSWRWMHDEMRATRDAQGQATELVGYWFDITERKVAEESLKAREEIFSSIVGQAADAVALVEMTTGKFLEFNRAAHEGLGYSREEFAAFRIGDIQAEHSAEEICRNIGLIHEQGGATFESRHRCHDGRLRDVRVSAKLLHLQGRECIAAVWSDITAAKRAEAELRKLSLAVEQSPATVVITDLTGTIEYVNARFTELTGYTAADVIGKNPRILKSGLTEPKIYADLWRTISQGEVWRGEIVNRKKTGEDFSELVIVTPVKDANGRATHYMALKEDITERKRAETQLRKLSRTVEQAPLSIGITDLQGSIEYVNPAFLANTGYRLDEVMGRNPRVLKSGLTPPETYVEMWRTLTRGEVWRGELTNRRKDGSIYVERAVIAPVVDDHGVATHYVALKDDISERKRTEAALQEAQERYRLMAENTSDVIWLYDLSTERFTYTSPSVFKLLGRTPEEMANLRMSEILKPTAADQMERGILPHRLASFAAGDESARVEIYEVDQLHRDGRAISTEVSSTLLADTTGRPTQILGITRDITERKRAEGALRDSEMRYRELFDLESDAIMLFDADTGRILRANQAAAALYGCSTADLEKLRKVDLSAAPELTAAAFEPENRFPGRVIHVPQRLHRRRDGSIFPVEISLRYFERDGRWFNLSAIRDVTLQVAARETLERFNAELEQKVEQRTEELEARTRQMRALLDAIPDTVMRLRVDGTILASQPARHGAPDLAAITPQIGLPTAPGAPAELVAANLALGRRALAFGTTVVDELELTTPNATMFLEMRSAPTGPDEFVAFVRDITERRRLEDALRQSTQRLRLATHAGGVGVWEFFPANKNLIWDDQMFSLYGITRETYSGAYDAWQKGLHPDDRQRSEDELQLALRGGKEFDLEFRVVWPDGSIHNIRAHALIVRDASGQVVQMLGTNWDITAQKQLEVETKAMLEKERQVSEMKTRFISVTSHEFRTPMAAALGSTDLLANHLERFTPAKRQELLSRIATSLHRMTAMLDDVLLLNRMDANRVEMNLVPVSLCHQLHSFIEEIRFGDRDAHAFDFQVSGEVENFATDLNLLHHIASNLLSNAVRYSPAGAMVTVCLAGGAEHVTLSVQDQGIGIPENDRSRIFEPFERGSNVGTIKGTGLGLNIVKRMTEMLGGTIAVEPVAPTGSRFTLILPRLPQPPSRS